VNITTNNKPRAMHAVADLPERAQADFDYIMGDDRYSRRLVRYLGHWYDVYDSQSVTRELGFDQFKGWDGIVSETFFSGVLFRFVGDDEVIVGRYFT
jgi:hypothetical protein